MLKVSGATLELGGRLLFENFAMGVGKGELVCLSGESGCGKTSLLRAILGFQALNEGNVRVEGMLLNAYTVESIRSKTAYIPQELFLPCEKVSEMVRMPFELKINKGKMFKLRDLWQYWDELGLTPDLYERTVTQLSGGQRQRILLSTCALLDKKLILIDEPTSALDNESTVLVARFFRKLAHQGAAVLAVSHNLNFMADCDRVIMM